VKCQADSLPLCARKNRYAIAVKGWRQPVRSEEGSASYCDRFSQSASPATR
jgi:hypothetical protein